MKHKKIKEKKECSICNYFYTVERFENHLNSKSHAKKANKVKWYAYFSKPS
tara:strand:- start:235 stop:387 length:153 start_codon:yes stop_codon:yes gene_type:complete